jgi:hypothetical protein
VNGSKAPKWVPPRESEGGDVGSAETLPRGRRSASTVVETGWGAPAHRVPRLRTRTRRYRQRGARRTDANRATRTPRSRREGVV